MGSVGWAILSIQLWGSFLWCSCFESHSHSKKPLTCALLASPSWTAVGFRVTLESYKEEAHVYVSPGKESLKHPQAYLASLPSTGRAVRMGTRIQLFSWGQGGGGRRSCDPVRSHFFGTLHQLLHSPELLFPGHMG